MKQAERKRGRQSGDIDQMDASVSVCEPVRVTVSSK